jgi:hypothetical protein
MNKGGWTIIVKEYWLSIDVYINLKLAICNSSGNKSLNLNQLGKVIESQMKHSYEIKYFKNSYQTAVIKSGLDNYSNKAYSRLVKKHVTVRLKVQSRVISGVNLRSSDELLLDIQDNKGDMKRLYGKANRLGGTEVALNETKVQNMINGFDNNTLPHELGHTLGLLHVNDKATYVEESKQYWTVKRQRTKDSINAMFSGDSRYMHDQTSNAITADQINIIIEKYKSNQLNKR